MTPDTVIMVDWSGGADRGPRPVKDAIWICEARAGVADAPIYMRNREQAETWLGSRLSQAKISGERLLVGFDFPFGYPVGFAQALTGVADPFAVWRWLAARVSDTRDGRDRWAVAAQANSAFEGAGPFWFNGTNKEVEGLPRRKPVQLPVREYRAAEARAKGAFSCWQLGGAGAVGSQVIMGLPVLERLRQNHAVSIWPFEPLEQPIAFVEIWPSLIADTVEAHRGVAEIKDAAQVRVLAERVSALAPAQLAKMLDVDAPEEGWIFGLGHEDELRGRAVPPLRNDCFALPPGVDWTPVSDALAHLRTNLRAVVGTETVSIANASGRVLAEDALALRANPPQANAAVDGYGFSGGVPDEGVRSLPLIDGRAAAGAPFEGAVPDGAALRILTGAAVPAGVDTIVLEEDCVVSDAEVRFRGPLKTGANTRRAGEDLCAGEVAVAQTKRLGAPEMALLAAAGLSELRVFKPLRVAILSTGDELREAGQAVAAGQISDANRPMLAAMLSAWGHEVVDLGIQADDRAVISTAFDQARAQADVLITSGGASAGDEDHVSALLSARGAMEMWRIAVKPGRPLALGLWDGMPVFGLPGNPVAAMVCAVVFARPALSLLAGQGWCAPQGFAMPAGFTKVKKPGRSEFQRARVRDGQVEVFKSEGSGRISGLVWADGLVALPHEALDVQPGTPVMYYPWSSFGL
ncbi:molybdopterin-binding protein [Roseobacteraceae bacterium S113]